MVVSPNKHFVDICEEIPAEAFSHDDLKKNLDRIIGIINIAGQFFLREI